MAEPTLDTTASPGAQDWTRIVALRQRDRRFVLPLSFMAALAASVWTGLPLAAAWLAGVVVFVGISAWLCRWVERQSPVHAYSEWVLTGYTLLYTGAYCGLAVVLITRGEWDAALVGGVILASVALSNIGEFAVSRRIGGAAMLAVLLAFSTAALSLAAGQPALRTIAVLAAGAAFIGYVVHHALEHARANRLMMESAAEARSLAHIAAEASDAKSLFLATMSHEIRTPLNGVMGMAQALDNAPLPLEQKTQVAILRRAGHALMEVVNDVLDLSKIEAGKLELAIAPFDLEEVMETSCATFAAVAAQKDLPLKLDIAESARGVYRGDAGRLGQIVSNLVSNAVKYTGDGGVTVTVTRPEDRLCIAVADTGNGVPAELTAQLFLKFSQLDASMAQRLGGTGLGLSICRDLCELMGGDIVVDTREGEGSTFTVRLPLERLEGHIAPAARPSPRDHPRRATPLRLLAAEDNAVNQIVLRTLLAQAGIEPVIVGDGRQAVVAWAGGDWDLVLMDIKMPVMDGLEATREIRRREVELGRRRVPIIALTANVLTHQIAELAEAGMDDHIGKPIDVQRLFEALDAALAVTEPDHPIS